jgi:hypothetical protein
VQLSIHLLQLQQQLQHGIRPTLLLQMHPTTCTVQPHCLPLLPSQLFLLLPFKRYLPLLRVCRMRLPRNLARLMPCCCHPI